MKSWRRARPCRGLGWTRIVREGFGAAWSVLVDEAPSAQPVEALRWCFGEWCRGPQPVTAFRFPNGRKCKLCYSRERWQKLKQRIASDPELRKRYVAASKRWRERRNAKGPEGKIREAANQRKKYAQNEKYRERSKALAAKRWRKNHPSWRCIEQSTVHQRQCTRRTTDKSRICEAHRVKKAEAA